MLLLERIGDRMQFSFQISLLISVTESLLSCRGAESANSDILANDNTTAAEYCFHTYRSDEGRLSRDTGSPDGENAKSRQDGQWRNSVYLRLQFVPILRTCPGIAIHWSATDHNRQIGVSG